MATQIFRPSARLGLRWGRSSSQACTSYGWLARGHSSKSSKQWLQKNRQDEFVKRAVKSGYRSRAAFKLKEIQKKFRILQRGEIVLDLGAAPGGWTQVATEIAVYGDKRRAQSSARGKVVAIDLLDIEPIEGATLITGDCCSVEIREHLMQALEMKRVDVVLSDMAPSFTGSHAADHFKQIRLAYMAFQFAKKLLAPGGKFVTKVIQGEDDAKLEFAMKSYFSKFARFKPQASRSESSEIFFVGINFYPDGVPKR